MSAPHALAVEALELERGGFHLGPIGAVLARGATLALLGPSASGKTTLLDLIAGLESPARGRVRVDGRCAYLMQELGLWEGESARANVQLVARDARRAARLLDAVGFAGLRETPAGRLSGGERQRVGLARALACDAALLLLDEPGAHLDRAARAQHAALVRAELAARGQACVVAGHELDDLLGYEPDALLLLDAGRVLAHGATDALERAPGTRRVAERLGYTSFVRARCAADAAVCALGRFALPPGERADGRELWLAWRPGGLRVAHAGADGPGGRVVGVRWSAFGRVAEVELEGGARVLAATAEGAQSGARVALACDQPTCVWEPVG